MEPLFFKTSLDFRNWLTENHDKKAELWVGFYKKSSQQESLTWDESVEQVICFGWIDGIRKSVDQDSYKIRFTPRKSQSIWSLKNIRTAEELLNKGLMYPSGQKAFEQRKISGVYSFEQEKVELNKKFAKILWENKAAWSFFSSQAAYYQKAATHWIMSAKQETTQLKRLNELIADSENQKKIKTMRRKNE